MCVDVCSCMRTYADVSRWICIYVYIYIYTYIYIYRCTVCSAQSSALSSGKAAVMAKAMVTVKAVAAVKVR
jgi:hypothetical protein